MGKGRSIWHHEPQWGFCVLTLNVCQVRAISNNGVRGRMQGGHRFLVRDRLSFTGGYTFSAGWGWDGLFWTCM